MQGISRVQETDLQGLPDIAMTRVHVDVVIRVSEVEHVCAWHLELGEKAGIGNALVPALPSLPSIPASSIFSLFLSFFLPNNFLSLWTD